MNSHLQVLLDKVVQSDQLTQEQKDLFIKAINNVDKDQSMVQFKLDRIEKDRKTLSVMLEETIEDLQKKTRAIEEQNHELEIGSALERVRSVAMGMKQRSDMLDVCRSIAHQLALLNVKEIRNVQTAIFYDDRGTYVNYEYYAKHDKTLITDVTYKNHPIQQAFASQMLKGAGEFFTRNLKGKELKEWYDHQKTTNQFADSFLETAESLNYYWFSLGPVALGISSYLPLKEEERDLFKRFVNVFELAYRRFLDIEKAEAQAREAQIQLALERVRARTMAMQKSDELPETSQVLFEQMKELGEPVEQLTIGVVQEENNVIEVSATLHGDILKKIYQHSIDEPFMMNKIYHAWKTQQKTLVVELKGDELNAYNKYRNELTKSEMFPTNLGGEHRRIVYAAFFSKGMLALAANEPRTPQSLDLLVRFAAVFDLTYTRFLDLQKAEAQSRGSQIQLALERVRARTMAMQHSDELSETAYILFQQFKQLGEDPIQITIGIFKEEQNIIEFRITGGDGSGSRIDHTFNADINEPTLMNKLFKAWKHNKKHEVIALEGKELLQWIEYRNRMSGKYAYETKVEVNERRYVTAGFFSKGLLSVSTMEFLSEETIQILERFASVFDQTYTRFLDLKNAEAQARESQIEAALERVRSRTMAMHQTSELQEVIHTVHNELLNLKLSIDGGSFVVINDDVGPELRCWGSGGTANTSEEVHVPHFNMAFCTNLVKGIKNGPGFFTEEFSQEQKKEYFTKLFEHKPWSDLSSEQKEKTVSSVGGYTRSVAVSKYTSIFIINHHGRKFTDAENDILKRFAKVFEQTYTRFLDLQKAEAQAREAQIELSLERVRAKAMTMQKSDDVNAAVSVVFEELEKLNLGMLRCGIAINHRENRTADVWSTSVNDKGIILQTSGDEPIDIHPLLQIAFEGWLQQKETEYELKGNDLITYYQSLKATNFHLNEDSEIIAKAQAQGNEQPLQQFNYTTPFEAGNLFAFRETEFPEEAKKIMRRFASVFNLTYKRFLDLQQAESQARESQIQLALERVRARTMAMHKSEDLNAAVAVVFEELEKLDLGVLRCGISVLNKEKRTGDVWLTSTTDQGSAVQVSGDESFDIHPLLHGAFEAWLRQEDFYYILEGDDLTNYYKAVKTARFELPESQFVSSETEYKKQYCNVSVYHAGGLFAFRDAEFPDEAKRVMKRFANVFDLTYKRFLDLQKAEAQAKEAQIEAALERVRSRTLAMHKSDELAETAAVLFKQLILLGIEPNRLYINIIKDENANSEFWITDEDGSKVSSAFTANLNGNATFQKMLQGWRQEKKSLIIDMQGEELQQYFNYLNSIEVPFKGGLAQNRRVQHIAYFGKGFIGIASPEEQPEETTQLLERFAAVFNLTYTRFNDLQIAEAQTHKANIETALERVRARALAMQQPEELMDVAQVMRQEMGMLGVEELETSSIYIHDENSHNAECWYAIKDIREPEKKLVADHFVLNLNETWVGRQMFAFYNSEAKQISIPMQGANRKEWIDYCSRHSKLLEGFYGDKIPDRTYHLYKFSNGTIGAATPGDISNESWELLQRAASVFSLAYSRFKDLMQARTDLQKLKEEKQRAEDALTELKSTQQQLVHAEKMASLGELTAGIAHEIQNPLNFVNNFSEVSGELLEEMKQELATGNRQLATEIADDVKQNLEKILHHGKRADAIVKGMLQHSRSSTGQKELTDINALADEYLRLAYHGLRAKDKTFNAKFETNCDNTIGKINIIPQDIGRVILNLINNAFYAVTEKKKQLQDGFEPTVIVSTKKLDNKIELRVIDNGNGIPQKVLDKIFQPFFTTKPTGEGTGLGLSLSYDIITKGHGGELKVETKEGEGTVFIIQLPNVSNQ